MGELKKEITKLNSKENKTQADKDRIKLLVDQRERIKFCDEDLEND